MPDGDPNGRQDHYNATLVELAPLTGRWSLEVAFARKRAAPAKQFSSGWMMAHLW
jgi:hypothetical protein